MTACSAPDEMCIRDKGYGATNFVADNTSAAGKAQNRRVELVVSGEAIGVKTVAPETGGAE